jgi:drug/metabolite transporter (DMT)-like permease
MFEHVLVRVQKRPRSGVARKPLAAAALVASPYAGPCMTVSSPDSHRLHGIMWMLVAAVMLTFNHASVRWISAGLHPFEVTFFRNLLGVAFVIPMLIPGRFAALRTARPMGHLVRAVFNAGFMLTYFLSLSLVPLAEATALSFTAPLASSVLAALILKERLTVPKIIGLLLGFAGVLVIVRPGLQIVSPGSLLIILSSVFSGLVMVSIRDLARTESSLTITAYVAIFLVPITLIPALAVWEWPTARQFGELCVMAFFATLGQLALSRAAKLAETSVIMPIDFTRMIWASVIGVLVFGDALNGFVVTGAAIILLGAGVASLIKSPNDAAARSADAERAT